MRKNYDRVSCIWCCRTTSVERFADQPPSASPLPWTVPTGAKTHLFDCVCAGPVTIRHVRIWIGHHHFMSNPCWPASTTNQSGLVTLTFDLESGVRVTCDVGYLCADFSLPRPLCSRLTPDVGVRDRQTDRRQTTSSRGIMITQE